MEFKFNVEGGDPGLASGFSSIGLTYYYYLEL
jgi:hypothetical protein